MRLARVLGLLCALSVVFGEDMPPAPKLAVFLNSGGFHGPIYIHQYQQRVRAKWYTQNRFSFDFSKVKVSGHEGLKVSALIRAVYPEVSGNPSLHCGVGKPVAWPVSAKEDFFVKNGRLHFNKLGQHIVKVALSRSTYGSPNDYARKGGILAHTFELMERTGHTQSVKVYTCASIEEVQDFSAKSSCNRQVTYQAEIKQDGPMADKDSSFGTISFRARRGSVITSVLSRLRHISNGHHSKALAILQVSCQRGAKELVNFENIFGELDMAGAGVEYSTRSKGISISSGPLPNFRYWKGDEGGKHYTADKFEGLAIRLYDFNGRPLGCGVIKNTAQSVSADFPGSSGKSNRVTITQASPFDESEVISEVHDMPTRISIRKSCTGPVHRRVSLSDILANTKNTRCDRHLPLYGDHSVAGRYIDVSVNGVLRCSKLNKA